ncbi:hypothetical protein HMPREF1624_04680 [Sporothrix schenckii ATCC 58251]|uniref:Uncharacterized protein n=1 Tax=Sporothrix schenckii (strain ATCC 58251 / de Perez 2211183) TaxID=1391915 RepID=U7PYD8_SPOS1|nr:hypothetical protein HMPREF1624_04680 [Sporothrix schenckii ATCC 58251]
MSPHQVRIRVLEAELAECRRKGETTTQWTTILVTAALTLVILVANTLFG